MNPTTRTGAAAQAAAAHSLLVTVPMTAVLTTLSLPTVKKMVRDRRLPGITRIGHRVMINRAALAAWVEQGCPPISPEDAANAQ